MKAPKRALAPSLLRKGAAAQPPSPRSGMPPGIKQACMGNTLYLLPAANRAVRMLAAELGYPAVHEMLLDALDDWMRKNGKPPLPRYTPPRARKG